MLRPYIDMSRFCQLVDNVAKDGAIDILCRGEALRAKNRFLRHNLYAAMLRPMIFFVGAKHCGQKIGFPAIIYMPQCFALTSQINPIKAKNNVGFRSKGPTYE
jgi:hypothetical protein